MLTRLEWRDLWHPRYIFVKTQRIDAYPMSVPTVSLVPVLMRLMILYATAAIPRKASSNNRVAAPRRVHGREACIMVSIIITCVGGVGGSRINKWSLNTADYRAVEVGGGVAE
jgi:hypothetical protein